MGMSSRLLAPTKPIALLQSFNCWWEKAQHDFATFLTLKPAQSGKLDLEYNVLKSHEDFLHLHAWFQTAITRKRLDQSL